MNTSVFKWTKTTTTTTTHLIIYVFIHLKYVNRPLKKRLKVKEITFFFRLVFRWIMPAFNCILNKSQLLLSRKTSQFDFISDSN